MKTLAMLAIGAAVAIAALGAESSAGKPSAEAAKFVSKRYAYSLVLTGQWKASWAPSRTPTSSSRAHARGLVAGPAMSVLALLWRGPSVPSIGVLGFAGPGSGSIHEGGVAR
jgi:hypothetical protein